jgi:hypothetical protein
MLVEIVTSAMPILFRIVDLVLRNEPWDGLNTGEKLRVLAKPPCAFCRAK